MNEKMNAALGQNSLYRYTGSGTTRATVMNFGMNHAPGAGSAVQPVDQQSSAVLQLPLPQIKDFKCS